MNNILKFLILNIILIYFLINNIKYAIIVFILLIPYLIYLKGNNILEGNSNKRLLDMININKELLSLINIFKYADRDCVGEYSDYTSCDKKCGESYKYSRYRVKQQAGIYGVDCKEEDGFTKKELCTVEDNNFRCNIGDPCDDNKDCVSLNCDPDSNTCKFIEKCSVDNLHLCDNSQCDNLNSKYDTSENKYIYDNGKCSLTGVDLDVEYEKIYVADLDFSKLLPDFKI